MWLFVIVLRCGIELHTLKLSHRRKSPQQSVGSASLSAFTSLRGSVVPYTQTYEVDLKTGFFE